MLPVHLHDLPATGTPATIASPASLRAPSGRRPIPAAYLLLIIALLVAVACPPAAALAGARADAAGVAPPSAADGAWAAAATKKVLDVNLTKQRLTAYENGKAVFTTLVSTGTKATPTPTGTFRVQDHIRSKILSGPGYYYPNVPYVMHFYGAYALHSAYWHKNWGHRMSHGCVQLPTAAAAWVYRWAPNGTVIKIHY
jgi:hypothetical protein